MTYQVPDEEAKRIHLASIYCNSVVINNLLKKYGEITYQLLPVSSSGYEGNVTTLIAQAGPSKKIILGTYKEKIDFDTNHVWTNNPELSGGPLSALIDNNENNFFYIS